MRSVSKYAMISRTCHFSFRLNDREPGGLGLENLRASSLCRASRRLVANVGADTVRQVFVKVGPAIAFRRDPNCIAGAGQKDAVADVIVGNNAGSESEFVLKFDPIAKVFAGFAVRRHVILAKEDAVPTVAVSDTQNYEVVAILQLDTVAGILVCDGKGDEAVGATDHSVATVPVRGDVLKVVFATEVYPVTGVAVGLDIEDAVATITLHNPVTAIVVGDYAGEAVIASPNVDAIAGVTGDIYIQDQISGLAAIA